MLQLIPQNFQKAAIKAATVRPAVEQHGARYFVSRSDGSQAVVRFVPRNGALWCECTCPAGSPQARQQPVPCYHVAAVLLASAPARPNDRAQLIADVQAAWHRARPFAALSTALHQIFGVRRLGDVSDDDLRRILGALRGDQYTDGLPDHGDHHYWN